MNILKALMVSDKSSLKVIKSVSGSTSGSLASPYSYTNTIPHGYGSDDIIIGGYVISSRPDTGTAGYSLPYVNALGENIVWVEWDATNVYVRFETNTYNGTGTWSINYTIIIMVP